MKKQFLAIWLTYLMAVNCVFVPVMGDETAAAEFTDSSDFTEIEDNFADASDGVEYVPEEVFEETPEVSAGEQDAEEEWAEGVRAEEYPEENRTSDLVEEEYPAELWESGSEEEEYPAEPWESGSEEEEYPEETWVSDLAEEGIEEGIEETSVDLQADNAIAAADDATADEYWYESGEDAEEVWSDASDEEAFSAEETWEGGDQPGEDAEAVLIAGSDGEAYAEDGDIAEEAAEDAEQDPSEPVSEFAEMAAEDEETDEDPEVGGTTAITARRRVKQNLGNLSDMELLFTAVFDRDN